MADPDLSFPPSRRLTREDAIQRVFDEGEFFRGTYCHLFRGRRDEDPSRAAFVVSQKTASRATERNRIKRLMRESFRLRIPRIREGWPLVILATRRAHGGLKRQDIDDELDALFREADVYAAGD